MSSVPVADSAAPRPTARRHLFAFIFIALVGLTIFVIPLARGHVFTFRDHLDYFQPLRWYTAEMLRGGELPLWNPYSASGEPWLANPQTGVFYPPTWLFLVMPFATAYMLYLLLHLLILGWGAYLLFARRASEAAALVGAVALMICGPTLSLLDVSNNLATFAWVPLVIWCALARTTVRGGVVLALAFLGGEPYFAALAAVLYVIVSWSTARETEPGQEPGGRLRTIAITAFIAAGLAAVQLLPFISMLGGSDRTASVDPAEALRQSAPLSEWLRVAIPPSMRADGFDAALAQHFIPMVYVGMLVVVLAVAGWITSFRRRDVQGWSALLVFSMLVASGGTIPFVGRVITSLPLMLFRYPARMIPFGALAIIAIAVVGWNRIRPDKRWLDLVIIALLIADVAPRARPLLQASSFRRDVVPYARTVGAEAKILRLDSVSIARGAWIAGYLNLYEHRFDASSAAPVISARYLRLHEALFKVANTDLRAMTAVGFLLSSRDPAWMPGWMQHVALVSGAHVYADPTIFPMATFWSRAVAVPSESDALRVMLEHRAEGALALSPRIAPRYAQARSAIRRVEQLTLGPSSARIVVDAPSDGVVLLTQQQARGWRVTVDGVPREALTAGGLFRAVEVGKGRQEIVWTYRPNALFIGGAMTFVTLCLLFRRAIVKGRRRKIFLPSA